MHNNVTITIDIMHTHMCNIKDRIHKKIQLWNADNWEVLSHIVKYLHYYIYCVVLLLVHTIHLLAILEFFLYTFIFAIKKCAVSKWYTTVVCFMVQQYCALNLFDVFKFTFFTSLCCCLSFFAAHTHFFIPYGEKKRIFACFVFLCWLIIFHFGERVSLGAWNP